MCRFLLFWPLLALVASGSGARAEPEPGLWVLVTTPTLRKAAEPLCEHRKREGFRVAVVESTDVGLETAAKLRESVNALCRQEKGACYVLLLGAVAAEDSGVVVPPLRGSAGRMKGQPTDNGYGNPGDDLIPTAAVGRLPARTPQEAGRLVAKTLAYEKDTRPGDWRRRLTVLAGAPAFSPAIDKLVEQLAVSRLDAIDPSWHGTALYHNPQSRFCVPDDRLRRQALDDVEQGQALTLFLGHSNAHGLAADGAHYLDRDDWATLSIRRGRGLFATFGCLGCQLQGQGGEGYGLAAVRNPNGPVAVLGSHGICFAAMVQLASDALFHSLCGPKPPERLGDVWLRVAEGVARNKIDALTFWLLDRADGDPSIPQAAQRREHLEMFLLLGDPALRLPVLPSEVTLTVDGKAVPGATLTVRGAAPARLERATVRLTLERPLSSEPTDLEPVPALPGAARDRALQANHDRANRFALDSAEAVIQDGRLEARLAVPAKAPWPRLLIRAYAATDRAEAMGTAPVALARSEAPQNP